MDNSAALHSKGWAGFSFAVLVVAQVVLTGLNPPLPTSGPDAVVAYLAAREHALLIAGWLTFPIFAFFLWFTVGISNFLRKNSAEDDGLPTFTMLLGVFIAGVAMLAAAVITTLTLAGGGLSKGETQYLWSLYTLVNGPMLCMGIAMFAFAIAHSMRRHGSAPVWLAWLGYVAALFQAIQTFGIFTPTMMVPATNMLLFIAAFALFVFWMICTAGYLVMSPGRAAAAARA
jgi:hypothetical protein